MIDFDQLHRDHFDWLTNTARRQIRNHHDAEDIAAETITRAWQHRADLETKTRDEIRRWLHATARRLTIDRCRRPGPEPRSEIGATTPDPAPSPETRLIETEELHTLRHALNRLGPETKHLLETRANRTPYAAIAQQLGTSQPAARTRTARARTALRNAYRAETKPHRYAA